MKDLIERLEKASEGSRRLDALIWQALHPEQPFMTYAGDVRPPAKPATYEPVGSIDFSDWPADSMEVVAGALGAPRLTTSLDAALTLVPEGWTWDVDATAPECGVDWTLHPQGLEEFAVTGTAPTPALALCIAALKARSASNG